MNNEHDQACYLRTVLMQKDEGWMILMKQQKIIGLETVLTPWPCKECKAIKCKEFELKLNMLYKELVKTQAKIEVLEDENLKFKEEMYELTNIETKVFFNFILSKPETMMQVEQCHYIFRNMCHLPASPAFMMEDIAEDVLQHLIQDFLQDSPDDPMPSLLCVKLLKLEMGYSWLVSNVLDPFFQRVGNEKNRHLKKLSQILKIYSEVEN